MLRPVLAVALAATLLMTSLLIGSSPASAQSDRPRQKFQEAFRQLPAGETVLDRIGQWLQGGEAENQDHRAAPGTSAGDAASRGNSAARTPQIPQWDFGGATVQNHRQGRGLVVQQVQPETPAARAGLEPGDRIVGVHGHAVHNANDLGRIIQRIKTNTPLPITVVRGNRQGVLTMLAGASNARPPQAPRPAAAPSQEPTPMPAEYEPEAPPRVQSASGPAAARGISGTSGAEGLRSVIDDRATAQTASRETAANEHHAIIATYEKQIEQLNVIINDQQDVIAQLETELRKLQAQLGVPQRDDATRGDSPSPAGTDGPALFGPKN